MTATLTTKKFRVMVEPMHKDNTKDFEDWAWYWGNRDMRTEHSDKILIKKVTQMYNKRNMTNGIIEVIDNKKIIYKGLA